MPDKQEKENDGADQSQRKSSNSVETPDEVGVTPGLAEGDEKTIEEDLRQKEKQQQ